MARFYIIGRKGWGARRPKARTYDNWRNGT